jgi:hypothetical protein
MPTGRPHHRMAIDRGQRRRAAAPASADRTIAADGRVGAHGHRSNRERRWPGGPTGPRATVREAEAGSKRHPAEVRREKDHHGDGATPGRRMRRTGRSRWPEEGPGRTREEESHEGRKKEVRKQRKARARAQPPRRDHGGRRRARYRYETRRPNRPGRPRPYRPPADTSEPRPGDDGRHSRGAAGRRAGRDHAERRAGDCPPSGAPARRSRRPAPARDQPDHPPPGAIVSSHRLPRVRAVRPGRGVDAASGGP